MPLPSCLPLALHPFWHHKRRRQILVPLILLTSLNLLLHSSPASRRAITSFVDFTRASWNTWRTDPPLLVVPFPDLDDPPSTDQVGFEDDFFQHVHPALKDDPPDPTCPEPPEPLKAITDDSLGPEADAVFIAVGPLCLGTYYRSLEHFLASTFPAHESDLSDPKSMRSLLRRYLNATLVALPPSDPARLADPLPSIPKLIHQTSRKVGFRPPMDTSQSEAYDPDSWSRVNPEWTYDLVEDASADSWVKSIFSDLPKRKQKDGNSRIEQEGKTKMLDVWKRLATTPALRCDLWRYLRLLKYGGVYAAMDTKCLKPIERWSMWEGEKAGGDGPWAGHRTKSMKGGANGEQDVDRSGRSDASVIVGIDVDADSRPDWHQWWSRPIQFSQWTMASSPAHPIFLDTIRRIISAFPSSNSDSSSTKDSYATAPGGGHPLSTMELTGPGPFTDSVVRYLGAMTEGKVRWGDLRGLPMEGLRIGDVLILPITAFSSGSSLSQMLNTPDVVAEYPFHSDGRMGAGENDEGAYVQHAFAGRWKPN